jgi:hypothetical protein
MFHLSEVQYRASFQIDMTYHLMFKKSNMNIANYGSESAYYSGSPAFTSIPPLHFIAGIVLLSG